MHIGGLSAPIIVRKASFCFLPGRELRSSVLADLLGRDERSISDALTECEGLPYDQRDEVIERVLGRRSECMPALIAAGAMLPVYECATKSLGPLCVMENVPRIDAPLEEIIEGQKDGPESSPGIQG